MRPTRGRRRLRLLSPVLAATLAPAAPAATVSPATAAHPAKASPAMAQVPPARASPAKAHPVTASPALAAPPGKTSSAAAPKTPVDCWVSSLPPAQSTHGGTGDACGPSTSPAPLLSAQILAAPGGTIDAAAAGRITAPPWPPLGPGPPGDPPSHPKNQGPPATRPGALKHDALPANRPGNAVPLRTPHRVGGHGRGARPRDVAAR